MKKMLCIGTTICMCLLMLASCTGKDQEVSSVDVKVVADRLASEITYEDTIAETNGDMARLLYGYEEGDVKAATVYISAGATTEEAAVFECTDEAAAQRVAEGAQQRIEAQKMSVQSYKPEELSRLEQAVLRTEGHYVVLSISDAPADAEKILDEEFGK